MQVQKTTYLDAGVDIAAGDQLVQHIKPLSAKTMRSGVLGGIGGFGALFEISKKYQNPVLVSGTDGVGTKLKLAFMLNKHDTIGIDLVAMSVNDILVQGAEPLFFLDYFACGKLNVAQATDVISGIAHGCTLAKCSLIGGETAEMPSMYQNGEYDLAGFAVGVVEKERIINGSGIREGDVILGLESSGFHSNGYSLVRQLIHQSQLDLTGIYDSKNGISWQDAIMSPTTIYVQPVLDLLNSGIMIAGMAHITGGGISGNIPRVIPQHLIAAIELNSLPKTPLFEWAQTASSLDTHEMLATFNCGIGYILVVNKDLVQNVMNILSSRHNITPLIIGAIHKRQTVDMIKLI